MTQRLRAAGAALLLALPLAIGWTIYTAQPTLGNFLLGYLFSALVVRATGLRGENLRLRNPLRQLYSLAAYIVFLASEVFLAGIKVARIILAPSLPIRPGLVAVKTQDRSKNDLISAISAHGITITPGELVVDFEEAGPEEVRMIVHSLNLGPRRLEQDQRIRLKRIKAILGYATEEGESA